VRKLGEEPMRLTVLAGLMGATLAITTIPAGAAEWKSYISRGLGFSFEAPGEL